MIVGCNSMVDANQALDKFRSILKVSLVQFRLASDSHWRSMYASFVLTNRVVVMML